MGEGEKEREGEETREVVRINSKFHCAPSCDMLRVLTDMNVRIHNCTTQCAMKITS